jgi:5-methylcytosine-specific restriction endonuclease McrA
MIIVQDVTDLADEHPDLVATIRREATMFGRLSATTLERLCCDAKICRVLTDGPSEILDIGRLTRSVPPAIWNALVARDRHCTAPGCDRSPEYCEAHHIWYWSLGGPTSLENLRLLCWYHHKQEHIHDNTQRK